MATETILIEFVTNDDQLKESEQRLADLGKVEKSNADQFKAANTEINKQTKALKDLEAVNSQIGKSGTNLKKTIADVSTAVKGMSSTFQKEFKAGAVQALKEAGVSLEQFESALQNTGAASDSLKSQLRSMTQALAQMKVEGKDNTEEYRALALQAGQLKDAIADANQEVKNFGSDTSTFDGLISLTSGIAGGFAAVQGAAALFGDESEELQKTLLRVNAAMAILQGLQQIQVVLQKESAAAALANTIATKAQTAAQALFTFVVGTSTGALKAFRIALAATGVGLLVLGLIELVSILNDTDDSLEEVNAELERQKNLVDALNKGIQSTVDVQVARAEAAGAAESQLIAIRGRGLQQQLQATLQTQREQIKQRDALKIGTAAWIALNKAIEANNEIIQGLNQDILIASIQFEAQLAREREEAQKKAIEDAKKRREEQLQREKDLRAAGFADFKASVQRELLASEEGSKEQLEIRKRLLRAQLQIELDNEKLTENQRKLLVQQFFKDRIELEKNFNRDRTKLNLENIQSGIQADLAQLELSQEDKLRITETGIRVQAEMERVAAEGNAARIAEIEAKRDKAIRDARIASIQEIVEYENRIAAATNGPEQRRLQRVAADTQQELSIRIQAIDRLAQIESSGITRRIDALNKEKEQKLISQRDYDLQYAELVDQQTKIWEDAEKAKTDATKAEAEKRKQQTIAEIQEIVAVAQNVIGVLESLYSVQAQSEENRINEQKQRLADLQEAGAITEKEAITRQKRIEAEERRIKQIQAQRDKQIAVFRALLAIPEAVLRGLTQGGPVLAAIYGALASVQAALVIARPIPKFGKGKKNRYEGLAEVGETGSELIERNGRMYLAPKRTITYLGEKDKVFNPMETAAMLSIPQMATDRVDVLESKNNFSIDYEKIGEAVGKHVQTNVFVDGVQQQSIKKNLFTKWLNDRRSL